jgi:hypothetical protein
VAEVAESVGGMVVAVEVSDILVFELLIDGLLGFGDSSNYRTGVFVGRGCVFLASGSRIV